MPAGVLGNTAQESWWALCAAALFESCTVHHTVRTRTRFFTKKGSGTFFVYGRFAVAECNEAMKAPVGLSSNRTVLRSKMEGPRPDKFLRRHYSEQ